MNYRKIWTDNYGPIPVDEDGISFEIHHKDGDRQNNDLSNLSCVSIREHFSIHFKQGDFQAALLILEKMYYHHRLKLEGWTPKSLAKHMAENKLGIWSAEIQAKANQTKATRKSGFCHNPELAAKGGRAGGRKGALITNQIHKERGTGVYSKEHQAKAGKKGGAIAGKIPKTEAQKAAIKSGMQEVWRLRREGLLPPRKPRTPKVKVSVDLVHEQDLQHRIQDPIDKTCGQDGLILGVRDTSP